MPDWLILVALGIAAWFAVSLVVGLLVGPLLRACSAMDSGRGSLPVAPAYRGALN